MKRTLVEALRLRKLAALLSARPAPARGRWRRSLARPRIPAAVTAASLRHWSEGRGEIARILPGGHPAMRPSRMTIRRLMIVVAGAGLALGSFVEIPRSRRRWEYCQRLCLVPSKSDLTLTC